MLPPRIKKEDAGVGRWKSEAHRRFVRTHACCSCHATAAIEFAHVRNGSDAGMGRKPSDFYGVSLCKPCHQRQHNIGEITFWAAVRKDHGFSPDELIAEFNRKSPKAREIAQAKRERGL